MENALGLSFMQPAEMQANNHAAPAPVIESNVALEKPATTLPGVEVPALVDGSADLDVINTTLEASELLPPIPKDDDPSFNDSGIVNTEGQLDNGEPQPDERHKEITREGSAHDESGDDDDDDDEAEVEEIAEDNEEEEEDEDEDEDEYDDNYGELEEFREEIGNRLETAFQGKENQAAFAATGQLPDAPNPGLGIGGLGPLGLPLSPFDAQRIIAISEQAPFGKQAQTIVDLSVRRTWQIEGAEVVFNNPAWMAYLHTLITKVGKELGMEPTNIVAHLYKLLLYGPGGHFEKHQDTEKEPGMFATLIVVLPSWFSGGQVSLSHMSKDLVFDSAPHSAFGTSFACWYTDVYHKVHPVTQGFRLALSFNLMLRSTTGHIPRAPVPDNSMIGVREIFQAWINRDDAGWDVPEYVGHILDYRYSKVGLGGFDNLKGDDRAKVAFLKDMAAEIGFSIYLAQLDITVTGSGTNMYSGYGRKRHWYDDDSDGGASDDTMDEEEEHHTSISLKNAVGVDGVELDLSRLDFSEEDLVPAFDSDCFSYDDKHCEGYQGNYGGDVNHFYHKTIVLLWRRENDFRMKIQGGGSGNILKTLSQKANAYRVSPSIQLRQEVMDVALPLIREGHGISEVARAALAMQSPDLFLRIGASHLHGVQAAIWLDAANSFGPAFVRDTINTVCTASSAKPFASSTTAICSIITSLQAALSNDDEFLKWADERVLALLTAIPIVPTLDENTVKDAVALVSRLGFEKSRVMLAALMERTSLAAQPGSSTYGQGAIERAAFMLVDELRKLPEDKLGQPAQAWLDDQEILLLQRSKLDAVGIPARVVQIAGRAGFVRCRELLLLLLKAHETRSAPAVGGYGYNTFPSGRSPIAPRLLADLRKVFVADPAGKAWLDERLVGELTTCAAVGEETVVAAINVAQSVGFARAKPMVDSMCKTLDKLSHTARPSSLTSVEIAVKVLDALGKEGDWALWSTTMLASFLLQCTKLSVERCSTLIRAVDILLQFPPATVARVLSGFRRVSYTVPYLLDVVEPFVKALRPVLEKKGISYAAPAFCDFAAQFGNAALKSIRKPEPLQPGDFTLPPINDVMVDAFLSSPVQHIHKIQAVQNVRSAIERRLWPLFRQGKIEVQTIRGRTPHTLLIRKSRPGVPPAHPLGTVLTPAMRPTWEDAVKSCGNVTCPHCHAIKKCLDWVKSEAQLAEFWNAFGKGVLNQILYAPRIVPLVNPVQPLQGQQNELGEEGSAMNRRLALAERPNGTATASGSGSIDPKSMDIPSVAGQKRKSVQTIAFIDLTESPPKKKTRPSA